MATITHRPVTVTPSDLLYRSEVAKLAGVTVGTFKKWRERHPAFPEPWKTGIHGQSDLYLRSEIIDWLQATGRWEWSES
jgi:predicted DNA-binding transcriptional regulator AlpA